MYSAYKTEGRVVTVNSVSIAFDPYLQRSIPECCAVFNYYYCQKRETVMNNTVCIYDHQPTYRIYLNLWLWKETFQLP